MQTRPLALSLPEISRRAGAHTEVGPANEEAARFVLRMWVAVAGFAVLYELLDGQSIYPALALGLVTALLAVALPSGRSVEVTDQGLLRRGLLTTRLVPWSAVKSITWRKSCGVERYRIGSVTLSSEGAGFHEAARRMRALAAFRGIPIKV